MAVLYVIIKLAFSQSFFYSPSLFRALSVILVIQIKAEERKKKI